MRFVAETVGRKSDSTGARPPNFVDIAGTSPIKEITVTDAVTGQRHYGAFGSMGSSG
jgi:hypothetical protein